MNTAAAEWMEARARDITLDDLPERPDAGRGWAELAAVIKLGEAFRDAVRDFLDAHLSEDIDGCLCRFCRWADHAPGNPEVDYRHHTRRDLDAAMYSVEVMLAVVPDKVPPCLLPRVTVVTALAAGAD